MTFSEEWEAAFRANTHVSVWPWSDLVSYVHRHAKPADGYRRVLELGCGVGANIPFFRALGVDYCAIEGSRAAVDKLCEAYPDLRAKILVGDFTQSIPFADPFDLVVDRAAVTHNTTAAIQHALQLIFGILRPSGKFVGIDWFSIRHRSADGGVSIDQNTRADISEWPFHGVGNVHFSDERHISGLLAGVGFRIERLEHKQVDGISPPTGRQAMWSFVAVKP